MMIIYLLVILLTVLLLHLFGCINLIKCNEIRSSQQEAIVITGCDSGIGLGLAKYFHEITNFKIICGFLNVPNSDGYKELNELNTTNNGRYILEKLDITSQLEVDNLVANINNMKQQGHIKELVALINNAGILAYGEFDWLSWDLIETQINVNLMGTMRMTRAMLPFIIESKGRILNVSSIADLILFPHTPVYQTTKAAITKFSQVLGYEMSRFGVRVVNLRPGPVWTRIHSKFRVDREKMWQSMDTRRGQLHGDSFHRVFDEFEKRFSRPAGVLVVSDMFAHFRVALLSKNPPISITCAPLHFKIFLFMLECVPYWLQVHLLDFFLPPELKCKTN